MTSRTATLAGVFAILFWSTNIAFSRSLGEKLGILTTAACLTLLAGAVSGILAYRTGEGRRALRNLPLPYLLGCGALFVGNMVAFYLAIGLSANHQQLVEAGIINYFWVPLTLVLSVPLLKKRARWPILPGILLSLAGIYLAAASQGLSLSAFVGNLRNNSVPYLWALATAICWASYSNLSRRWAGEAPGGAVPLFLLATGIAMLAIRRFFPEHPQWSWRLAPEMAFVVIFPTILAYNFWDQAMRRGNLVLVAALSYFIPLLSTLITCLYLHVAIGPGLLVSCTLVIAGAVLCKLGIK